MKMSLLAISLLFVQNSHSQEALTLNNSTTMNFLEKLESEHNIQLSKNTKKWMKRWKNIDLDDLSTFQYKELSGTTSVNLKIHKIDPTDSKGVKSFGTFMGLNDSGNPNTEIAYFQFAALLGIDKNYRPAMRYHLGSKAQEEFKKLMLATKLIGKTRNLNKEFLLKEIAKNKILDGALKAKKDDTAMAFETATKTSRFSKRLVLNSDYPFLKALSASEAQPRKGEKNTILKDYVGDEYELSKVFSQQLTIDVVFGQYDRFSGGNIVIEKDQEGVAHFISSDNGGADVVVSKPIAEKVARMFSRYDRNIIAVIKDLNQFLKGEKPEFYGYTSPQTFVVDLGLYYRFTPERYVKALIENTDALLNAVNENQKKYGEQIYFQ
jgi:hypothetical protein